MSKYLILGSTSGFGVALFKKICTDENNTIYLVARSKEKNDAMLENLKSSIKAKVVFSQWDCSDVRACAEALKPFDLSDLNYCFFAFGLSSAVGLKQLKYDYMSYLYNVNYFSFVEFINRLIFSKPRAQPVNIVVCSSIATISPEHSQSEYSGAKLLLENFIKNRQQDLLKFNIRVNAISPGLVDTNMALNYIDLKFGSVEGLTQTQKLGLIPVDFIAEEVLRLFKDPYACSDIRTYSAGLQVF